MTSALESVCREAGCSAATVSRVLNDSPLVKESTRERVLAAVTKYDYRPAPAGRWLRVQRTETIGILSPNVGSGFFTDVLLGADAVAMEHQYHLMTAFSHGPEDHQKLFSRIIHQRRVDALVVLDLDLHSHLLADSSRWDMPVVSVCRPAVERGIPSVSIDNHAGGYSVMQHLLEHGYRDIALFTGPDNNYDSRHRLEGCLAAARNAGADLAEDRIHAGWFTMKSGKNLMQQMLDSGRKLPEAILALNDAMAMGAMGVLREQGLSVPGDLAIAGFDDNEAADSLGLTTIQVSHNRMGEEAVRLALAALANEEVPQHIVVPTRLVVRRSCGC
jgi:LacI family transcriptional regulator